MKNDWSRYYGRRFPPEIIGHAIWVYHRFCLSFRRVEGLLAGHGIIVSYETIRLWCQKFGPEYAPKTEAVSGSPLWRAVDQDGDVIDVMIQRRRDQRAAAHTQFHRRMQ